MFGRIAFDPNHSLATGQWGKLFQVLEGGDVRVIVDVPDSVAAYLYDSAKRKEKSRVRTKMPISLRRLPNSRQADTIAHKELGKDHACTTHGARARGLSNYNFNVAS